MNHYHKPALAGNAEGLPKSPRTLRPEPLPNSLSAGGRLVFKRTRFHAATCNLIASLAGIGQETDHAR